MRFGIGVLTILISAASAQQFEVASVRPVAEDFDSKTVGVHIDGAMVVCKMLAMRDYIRMAYQIKQYQVIGPDWINSTRYDINAKIPEGATRAQLPAMLQSLLAERFKLTVHNEKKEFNVYALTVAKEGAKLQESAPEEDGASAGPATVNVQGGRGGSIVSFGRGSYIRVADRTIEAKRVEMVQLIETLADYLDRPLVDMTGLTKKYDLTLEYSLDDLRTMLRSRGVFRQIPDSVGESMGAPLSESLKKVGLRLEPRKAPLDVLVIDRVEKTPLEN